MIRGKCHTFSDLCFVKVKQWGAECVEEEEEGVIAISQRSPGGAPPPNREPLSRNKNSMCGTSVLACVLRLRPKTRRKKQSPISTGDPVQWFKINTHTHKDEDDKQWHCESTGAETAGIEDFNLRMNASITLIILYVRLRTPTPSLILPLISVAPFSLLLVLIWGVHTVPVADSTGYQFSPSFWIIKVQYHKWSIQLPPFISGSIHLSNFLF